MQGDAEHLGGEPGDADDEERAEDDEVLGLALDADAVRPLHVAPGDRPQHAAEEHQPGGVTDEGVRLVGGAVEELPRLRELVVDLEHRGHGEQDEEPEVDHRVHQPGGRIAQQRAHVDAGAVVAEAALGVLRRGQPARRRLAPLPVLHPVGEAERAPRDHHRDDRVEGQLERAGDVDEDLAVDRAVLVPLRDQRHDAGQRGEHGEPDAEPDGEVPGTEPGSLLGVRRLRRLGVSVCAVMRRAEST